MCHKCAKTACSLRKTSKIVKASFVKEQLWQTHFRFNLVETISIKSYDHKNQSEAKILKHPDANIIADGSGLVIIDDLVDSGKTMQLVKEMFPKAHYASVYAKPNGRKIVDTFITEVSQDTWIFFPWDMALQYVAPYRGDGW